MLRPVSPGRVALLLVLMVSAALAGCSSKSGQSSSSSGSGSDGTMSSSTPASDSTGSNNMSSMSSDASKSGEASKSGSASKKAAAGAGAMGASKSASAASSSSASTTKLLGTDWRIADVGGQAVSTQSQATMKIGTDGQVSGNSGCNQFTGKATLSGHSLHFGPMASTRKACEPALMSQEKRLFEDLGKVAGYSVDEKGDLHLTDPAGISLMRLERATP